MEGIIDQQTGLAAFFISKDDLIASKLAAVRIRDLADVEEIGEATRSQEPLPKKKTAEPKGSGQ